ncbi:hypothetical protein KFL_005490050 [Klebsormidium nitens]|uniref:Ubiquitin-like domain-containing protein n=1 Tax=Klebsormidium nitens TaxID=105231 RepID=A0A1Y1IFP7_KLENI|nr:hypothetical protein KFL_005490050 [Klebsormidium nitens]|eukprot:GAQ89675.1 hypothetical protein KFL_005490050 [Klebsormidium nitens]
MADLGGSLALLGGSLTGEMSPVWPSIHVSLRCFYRHLKRFPGASSSKTAGIWRSLHARKVAWLPSRFARLQSSLQQGRKKRIFEKRRQASGEQGIRRDQVALQRIVCCTQWSERTWRKRQTLSSVHCPNWEQPQASRFSRPKRLLMRMGSKPGKQLLALGGSVCQRARQELGAAGLLWTEAAWESSLAAAMTGLESLATSMEVGLLDGFNSLLCSVKSAHMEGLKHPASGPGRAERGACHVQEGGGGKAAAEHQTAGASGTGEERRPICCPVKAPGGRSVQLQMPPAANVGALKGAIAERIAIPSSEQKLVARGKQLRNASRLEQLCSGEALDVALNLALAGGGEDEREADERTTKVQAPSNNARGLFNPSDFSNFQLSLREERRQLAAAQEQRAASNNSQVPSGARRPNESDEELSQEKEGTRRCRPRRIDDDSDEERRPQHKRKVILSQSSSGSDSGEGLVGPLPKKARDELEHHQHSALASEDESQGSETEGEGEDIEGAELESATESSDEETSQDREMIDDASQEEESPVIRAGQLATLESSDSKSLSQILGGHFKRRAPKRASIPLRTGRRSRVVLSSPEPSSQAGSQASCQSHAAKDEELGVADADQLMPEAADGSSLSEPEEDSYGWWDGFAMDSEDDSRLVDDFAKCVIVPRAHPTLGRASLLTATPERDDGDQSIPSAQPSAPASPAAGPQVTGCLNNLTDAPQSFSSAGRGLRLGQPVRERSAGAQTGSLTGQDAPSEELVVDSGASTRPRALQVGATPASSAERQLEEDGAIIVHREQDGKLFTVKKAELGTFFFAKRKFTREPVNYKDPKDGPQGFCRRYGEVLGHRVEIRRLCPSREFGSYSNWPTAYPFLEGQQHLEEAIKTGCVCKPYLDLERDGGLPEGVTLETVIRAFEAATIDIFREDYDIELPSESFNFLPCDYGPSGKFSLHLVVSTHSPQYVYRSNLAAPVDHQGAGHLAKELARRLPPRYAELIDQSVYTKNRGIRLPFCSKPATPRSRLVPLDETKPYADACITWLDDHIQTIKVPASLPDVVAARLPRTRPEHFRYQSATTASAYVVQRCTELLLTLHPTAYRKGSVSANSLNFSWYDRSEPCYSGHVHEGSRDILVIADPQRNAVFAKSDSARLEPATGRCCKVLPARFLGPFYADVETWKDEAVEVNMRYLERDPLAAAPMDLEQIRGGFRPLTDKVVFNDVLNKWQEGRYKAALIRSPMGTGKSTVTRAILEEPPRPHTALMITYRQTQASDAAGSNPDFAHYCDLKTTCGRVAGDHVIKPLADRELYPRVICQVDSLPWLLGDDARAPAFDLLILDEIESILAHLSADTLSERHVVIRLIVDLLRRARRVICLDGHLGQRTFDFLTLHGIRCGAVIINKHVPERPLDFEFLEGQAGLQLWESAIFEALSAGQNVFVVSMSSDRARALGSAVAEQELVEEKEVLIITRHSDGEVKRGLSDVNRSWKKRLVIISPTVEAGVDFNQPWFHRMFLYICKKSTHPRGLDQMKGRVRQLVDSLVLCFVREGIKLPTEGPEGSAYRTRMGGSARNVPRLGVEETYQWFLNRDEKVGAGLFCEGPVTRLLAHNEKEQFNGRTHFYEEFTELLESDGHVVRGVRVVDPAEVEAPGAGDQPRGRFLLEEMIRVSDITPGQFAAIEARVRRNEDYPGDRVQVGEVPAGTLLPRAPP